MNKHPIKFPSTRTCLVSDVLSYAGQMNGKTKQPRHTKTVQEALGNIASLSKISMMRWSERKWALKALKAIEAIGIMDRLEMLNHLKPDEKTAILEAKNLTSINKMGKLADKLGLQVHKVNGRILVIRGSQMKTEDVPTCKADLV
jgi:hypothetical protein